MGRNVVGVPLSTKLEKALAHRIQIPEALMVKDMAWPTTWPNGDPRPQLTTSVALTDHIRVLDKLRLLQPKMGTMTKTAIGGLEVALASVFDIR
jgi:mRNA-degrading endonuclease toxin of MazEF toxin-antitoxin module